MPIDPQPSWGPSDLKRPVIALGVIVSFSITLSIAIVASCNVHELGHAVVATLLGWEVDRISLCLPSGGGVEYAAIGTWAGNLQGYAGGFIAAAFLGAIYIVVFERPARPLGSPAWWAAGLGVVLPIGPQIVVGLVEGLAGPGQDYTVRYASVLPMLVFVALLLVAFTYVWRWRAVWSNRTPRDHVNSGPP